MVTVGAQSSAVSGVNVQVTLNSNIYAIAKTFTMDWGNKLDEEAVIGTDIPVINTNAYHGEGSMEIVYSTENTGASEQFAKLLTPVVGQIPAIGLVATGKDVSSVTRTFTYTGSVWPQKTSWESMGPNVVKAKISFIFTARPTLT